MSSHEECRGRSGCAACNDDGLSRTHRIHDGLDLVPQRLPWWERIGGNWIRGPHAATVEPNDPPKTSPLGEERPGMRIVPLDVERRQPACVDDEVDVSFAQHLVCDPLPIQLGVAGASLHSNEPTYSEGGLAWPSGHGR